VSLSFSLETCTPTRSVIPSSGAVCLITHTQTHRDTHTHTHIHTHRPPHRVTLQVRSILTHTHTHTHTYRPTLSYPLQVRPILGASFHCVWSPLTLSLSINLHQLEEFTQAFFALSLYE